MLEGERAAPGGRRASAGDPPGELGVAVGSERAPPIRSSSSSLTAWVPARGRARASGTTRIGQRSTSSSSRWTASPISVAARPGRRPGPPAPRRSLAQAADALGVVAVRAALEERERRVGELPDPVERRRRRPARSSGSTQPRTGGAEGSSPKSASCALARRSPAARAARAAVGGGDVRDRRATRNDAPATLELEDRAAGGELLLAVELREHPADRRVALLADGARDEQPVDRPRHRDVVEAQALGAVRPRARPPAPPRRRRRAAAPRSSDGRP